MHTSAVNLLARAGCLARAALAMLALALAACASSSRQAAPTAAPIVIATVAPTASAAATQPAPTPVPPPTPAGPPTTQPSVSVYVTNTGGQGLTLRQTPGGTSIGVLPDGSALTTTGDEQPAGDRLWRKVRDGQGREGWVAAEFLTTESPQAATPSIVAAVSPSPTQQVAAGATASPTWPVPLIPTATLRPAGDVPTRTPRPRASPIPVGPSPVPPIAVLPAPATKLVAQATGAALQATKPAVTGNCHASYPDFCIPPPPPDLDCSSAALAGRRRFTVRPPDPHLLDSNKDGIGCD
jgi:hypothetical protein